MSKKRTAPLSSEELTAIHARLGKEPDSAIASDFGVHRSRITQIRNRKGIPPYSLGRKMAYPVPVHFQETDARNMDKAMKKINEKNRSEYIRGAVRKRNKEVLG